ncbi:MAG: hypothetical protein J7L96_01310, partial [Bacteroidales bacterium]|nr:hypothetical protein [Bacteroidales bacterium]
MMRPGHLLIIFFVFIVLVFSCENPGLIENPDAQLGFSTDTVLFDTVFTTIGSTTANFRVY